MVDNGKNLQATDEFKTSEECLDELDCKDEAEYQKMSRSKRWKKDSKRYLHAHPLCVKCISMNPPCYTRATVVDHIVPPQGDPRIFWDEGNWQALCKSCYDHKTLIDDTNKEENVEVQNGE